MTLVTEWERLRAQLDRQDAQVIQRLVTAYGESYLRLQPEIDALIEFLNLQLETGKLISNTVAQSATFKRLVSVVEVELDTFEGYLKTEVSTASNAAARAGLSGGAFLLLAGFSDALGVPIEDVPRELVTSAPDGVLDYLNEYLDKLSGRIDNLSGFHSEQIKAGILDQVAQGYNPQKIGKWITDAYGMGLTDSMRMTRTAQLYSYREANRAMQVANADVLQGVVWSAELDDRVCMSCVALNGKVFPVGTLCNDHHNGRCAMLPLVNGVENPLPTGESWFVEQPEQTQLSMLGKGKFEAWKDGKFTFDQLSTVYEDEVFGEMRAVASLKSLVP